MKIVAVNGTGAVYVLPILRNPNELLRRQWAFQDTKGTLHHPPSWSGSYRKICHRQTQSYDHMESPILTSQNGRLKSFWMHLVSPVCNRMQNSLQNIRNFSGVIPPERVGWPLPHSFPTQPLVMRRGASAMALSPLSNPWRHRWAAVIQPFKPMQATSGIA
jgi:hypothetical protein